MGHNPVNRLSLVTFGLFEADLSARKLTRGGREIHLENQPFQVLTLLVERDGDVVTREELRKALWPDNTFVEFDDGLNTAVRKLRYALGDVPESPIFIETIPRRGYRFIAPIIPNGPKRNHVATEQLVKQPAINAPLQSRSLDTLARYWSWKKKVIAIVAVIVVITGGYVLRNYSMSRARSRSESLQFVRLTDSGKVEDVAISPDGRYIAYLYGEGRGWEQTDGWEGGKSSLLLRQVETRSEVQILTQDADLYPGLSFSPDGDYIYFLRQSKSDQLIRDLYVIPTLGGKERMLLHDIDTPVSFSPNGLQFAYCRGVPKETRIELRVANRDGSGDHLESILQNGASYCYLAWSPDGHWFAVTWLTDESKTRYVLDVIAVGGGVKKRLLTRSQPIGRPHFKSDGLALLVIMQDDNRRGQLWTISLSDGKAQPITNDPINYSLSSDVSRDRKTLATTDFSVNSDVWSADSGDLGHAEQLAIGDLPTFKISGLPGGKLVTVRGGDWELWVMNPDGSQPRAVSTIHNAYWPNPCGRFLIFTQDGLTVTRTDVDGLNPKTLATGYAPVCSPDGKFVFFAEISQSHWKIRRVSIDGGPPLDVVENPGESIPGELTITRDGKLLAFPFDVYAPVPVVKIGIASTTGGGILQVLDVPGMVDGGPKWSADGKSVQYLLDRDGASNLWDHPLTGTRPRQLTAFTSGKIFDFKWSADGKRLFYSRGEIRSNVVLLRGLQ